MSLNQIVSAEMKKHVLPIIASKMDATKSQIQADIAQKISVSDLLIKENISNICKSRVIYIFAIFAFSERHDTIVVQNLIFFFG